MIMFAKLVSQSPLKKERLSDCNGNKCLKRALSVQRRTDRLLP